MTHPGCTYALAQARAAEMQAAAERVRLERTSRTRTVSDGAPTARPGLLAALRHPLRRLRRTILYEPSAF